MVEEGFFVGGKKMKMVEEAEVERKKRGVGGESTRLEGIDDEFRVAKVVGVLVVIELQI